MTTRVQNVKELVAKRDRLWAKLRPEILRRLTTPQTDAEIEAEIRQAEKRLAAVTVQEDTLRARLNKLKVENKKDSAQVLKLANAKYDLEETQLLLASIQRNLYEKEFSAKSPIARISLEYPATRSDRPDSMRRTQAMVAAPFGMGLLVIGLLALLELRGARVSDPDELASRINVQVIGVVPPLPGVRHLLHMSNGNGNGHANGTATAMATVMAASARSSPRPTSGRVASSMSSCRASTTFASPSAPVATRGDATGIAC